MRSCQALNNKLFSKEPYSSPPHLWLNMVQLWCTIQNYSDKAGQSWEWSIGCGLLCKLVALNAHGILWPQASVERLVRLVWNGKLSKGRLKEENKQSKSLMEFLENYLS